MFSSQTGCRVEVTATFQLADTQDTAEDRGSTSKTYSSTLCDVPNGTQRCQANVEVSIQVPVLHSNVDLSNPLANTTAECAKIETIQSTMTPLHHAERLVTCVARFAVILLMPIHVKDANDN